MKKKKAVCPKCFTFYTSLLLLVGKILKRNQVREEVKSIKKAKTPRNYFGPPLLITPAIAHIYAW